MGALSTTAGERTRAPSGPLRNALVQWRKKSPLWRSVVVVVILVMLAWSLLPIYWMIATSLKTSAQVALPNPTLYPHPTTAANYSGLFNGPFPFGTFLENSVVTAVITSVITVVLSALAGYSFSRGKYLMRGPLTYAVLATQMLPLAVLLVPLYLEFLNLHLLNSDLGLIIGYCSFSVPFGSWLMKGFIDGIPIEIENAARVDGSSQLFVFLRVTLPLAVAGLITTGVFVFINTWNNLLYPLTFITTLNKQTLPPGLLLSYTGQFKTDWGGMMAAAFLMTLPLAVAFFAIQRFLVRGLTAGALTGV
ncbi:MAG: carbohydrate ABC transporter permease [Acidimicrobiales bacterium]